MTMGPKTDDVLVSKRIDRDVFFFVVSCRMPSWDGTNVWYTHLGETVEMLEDQHYP